MIAYLDTSALLKLYLEEPGSERVRNVVAQAAACTHLLAWVEVHAGLAMASRMGRLSDEDMADHMRCFDADWQARTGRSGQQAESGQCLRQVSEKVAPLHCVSP